MRLEHNFVQRQFFYLLVIVLVVFVSQPVWAGDLADFEQDATEENKDKEFPKKPPRIYDEDEDDEDDFWEDVMELMATGILGGGVNSWGRIHPEQTELTYLQPREPGESLIPFLRLDAHAQNVEADITAFDFRAEGGYGPFGLQVRATHYDEQTPSDELNLIQWHGLYRMTFGSRFELDLGLGQIIVVGDDRNSGFSFTSPILIYPSKTVGVEFRPAWATVNDNAVNDYDLGLVLNYSYLAVRAGYRWMRSDRESLDGPYLGLSLKF